MQYSIHVEGRTVEREGEACKVNNYCGLAAGLSLSDSNDLTAVASNAGTHRHRTLSCVVSGGGGGVDMTEMMTSLHVTYYIGRDKN